MKIIRYVTDLNLGSFFVCSRNYFSTFSQCFDKVYFAADAFMISYILKVIDIVIYVWYLEL